MNDRKVTIYTIAQHLGVSPSAVSRAFNPKTRLSQDKRELILRTAAEMGYHPNIMASRLSGEPIRIGVLLFSNISAYTNEYEPGILDAMNALSDYKVTCTIRKIEAENSSLSGVEEFLKESYDGFVIGLGMADEKKVLEFLPDTIPVISLDSACLSALSRSVSRSDSISTGRIAAQLLDLSIRTPNPKIAVFLSDKERLSQKMILNSFQTEAESYGFGKVSIFETHDNPEEAVQKIEELFAIDIPDGIYIATANSLSICQFMEFEERYRDTIIIASDIFQELNDYIRKGIVTATIYQNPYQQAYNALRALALHLINGDPMPEEILVNPTIVLKSNLHLYEHTD